MADKLTKWMSFFQYVPVRWIINLFSLFFVLLICWVGYYFLQSFASEPTDDVQSEQLSESSSPPVDVTSIKNWHLFGQAPLTDAKALPNSSSNLILQGIFHADDAEQSYVVIVGADAQEKTYHVGDKLPGGAEIEEILPDAVVLSRAGEREKLSLPRKGVDFAPPPPRGFSHNYSQ